MERVFFAIQRCLSNKKQGPWLFRVYRGCNPTKLCGDHFIKHPVIKQTRNTGIPMKQRGLLEETDVVSRLVVSGSPL